MGDWVEKLRAMWRGSDGKSGGNDKGLEGQEKGRPVTREDSAVPALVKGTMEWFEAQFGGVLDEKEEAESPQTLTKSTSQATAGHSKKSLSLHTAGSSKRRNRRRSHSGRREGKQVVGPLVRELSEASSKSRLQKRRKSDEEITLLILGTSGSGKSTLVHQIDKKFSFSSGTVHPREWAGHVRHHILVNMVMALKELSALGVDFGEIEQMKRDFVKAYSDPRPGQLSKMSPNVTRNLKRLWKSKPMQKNLDAVSKGVHLEFMDEFIQGLDRIASESYVPTFDDILRAHVRTTGVWDHQLKYRGYNTVIREVGGVRSERRKWRYLFGGVDAVLFVAAVGEFDQMLYEDHSKNSLDESLDLFKDLVKGEGVFKGVVRDEVPIFLVLNKTDVLLQKLEQTDKLVGGQKTSLLLSYDGPNMDDGVSRDTVYEYVSEHIKRQFLKYCAGTNRRVYPIFLNATDVKEFVEAFTSIMSIIIYEDA